MTEQRTIALLSRDSTVTAAISQQFELSPHYALVVAPDATASFTSHDWERVDLALVAIHAQDCFSDCAAQGYRGPALLMAQGDRPPSWSGDSVALPVRFSALIQRMRGLIQLYETGPDAFITIGDSRVYIGSRSLIRSDGRVEKLTDKETDILRFMHRMAGNIITRDQLLAGVWGYDNRITTHTLETHIYRLRQKLEIDPANAQVLVTEPGGYRLIERLSHGVE